MDQFFNVFVVDSSTVLYPLCKQSNIPVNLSKTYTDHFINTFSCSLEHKVFIVMMVKDKLLSRVEEVVKLINEATYYS